MAVLKETTDTKKNTIVEFTIDKIAEFEGKEVFILTNDNERRFVESEKYKDFGLKIGDRVETEFKKANCAGTKVTHIYHPRYKTGETYMFTIKKAGIIEMQGYEMHYADICDDYGFYQRIRINPGDIKDGATEAACRVTGMYRGKLHLLLLEA